MVGAATSLLMEQNFERAPMQRKTCSSGGFPWTITYEHTTVTGNPNTITYQLPLSLDLFWEIDLCSASKKLWRLFAPSQWEPLWLHLLPQDWCCLTGQENKREVTVDHFSTIWSTVNSLLLFCPIPMFTLSHRLSLQPFYIGLHVCGLSAKMKNVGNGQIWGSSIFTIWHLNSDWQIWDFSKK